MDIISPASVLDVGCGRGAWLSQFVQLGVTNIKGLDASFVDQDQLLIDRSKFQVADLSKPFAINEQFDLTLCLEVAEHIPPVMSRNLVAQLAKASHVVLFSAAIPGQRGTRHINEQWHCYWHQLFAEQGYECYDVLRSRIFANKDVAWWFRQNLFFYAARGSNEASALKSERSAEDGRLVPIASHVLIQYMTVTGLLRALNAGIWRAVRNRLVKLFGR